MQFHVRDLRKALIDEGHTVSVLAPAEDDDNLPDFVTSTGRPVAVRYNGSVARLNLGFRSTRRVREWIRSGDFDVMRARAALSGDQRHLRLGSAGTHRRHLAFEHGESRVLSAGYYLAQTVMEKTRGRIAVSELARRTLVDHVGGDAVLIPNGVDCAAFAEAEPLPGWSAGASDSDGPVLFFLGRLDEPAGLVDLARRDARHRRAPPGYASCSRALATKRTS